MTCVKLESFIWYSGSIRDICIIPGALIGYQWVALKYDHFFHSAVWLQAKAVANTHIIKHI